MARTAPVFRVNRYVSARFSIGRFTLHRIPRARTIIRMLLSHICTSAKTNPIITKELMMQPAAASIGVKAFSCTALTNSSTTPAAIPTSMDSGEQIRKGRTHAVFPG